MRGSAPLAVLLAAVLVAALTLPALSPLAAGGHECCRTTRACARAAMSCCTSPGTLPPAAPAQTAHLVHAAPVGDGPVSWGVPPAVPAVAARPLPPVCPDVRSLLRLHSVLQI